MALLCGSLAPNAHAGTPAGEPPAEALIEAIPFHPSTPPGDIVIDLAPEGRPAFLLTLDTGAAGSYLTPLVARSLGVNVRRTRSSPYREPTRLGRDLQFWVDTSASDTGVGGGSFETGLLGADFMDDYVVEIDYPGRMVRFYDPEKYEVPEESPAPGIEIVPIHRNGTRFFVEVDLEGETTKALVDTGASMVIVGKQAARKAGIDASRLGDVYPIRGLRGLVETRYYEAARFRVGRFDMAPTPVLVEISGVTNFGGPMSMLLGYDVLGQFKLRIDYGRKRLWMQRATDPTPTFLGRALDAPPSAFDRSLPRPTDEEIAAADAERLAEFERTKEGRLYALTPNGGFVVVDGYRLRKGPKPGETWYSHEEMREMVEASASRQGTDSAPR